MVWKVFGIELSKDAPWNYKAHNLISKKFAGFGAYASRHVMVTFILGALVTFIFCFGVYIPSTNKDFDDLWMRRNDRLRPEAEKYNAYFGGLPRQHSVTIRRSDGALYGTEISLNTMRAVLDPILHPNDNTLSSRLTFNSYLGASGSTPIAYGGTDFCETPGVPPAFKRLGYNVAYAYRQLTVCIDPTKALPDGWEITSFPCRRYSALDCFAEGNFDYPSALKQLDSVSRIVAASPNLESCFTQLQANLTGLMNSTTGAASVVAQTRTAVQLFKRWGYSNRFSYTGKTRSAISTYLYTLKDNDAADGATCQDKGLSCCLSWDGTKVPRQLVFDQDFVDARTTWFDYHQDSPIYANIRPLSGTAARLELSEAWEGAVRDYLLPRSEKQAGSGFETSGIYGAHTLNFITQRSVNDQVTTATGPEIYIICVGYALVLVYSGLVLSKWSIPYTAANAVYSRLMLAVCGVFTVMFATIASFGFAGIVGIEYNYLVVNTVPMLSLLFGMHNVYILVSTMLGFSTETEVTTRIKRTWAVAGPSIFLKTVVCATVFMVASTYPVPLVRSLCWFLAVCEVANFWTLLTVYSPLVCLDAARTRDLRSDCCVPPFVILGGVEVKQESFYDETGRFVGRFIRKYEHLLTHLLVKIVIILAFIAFLIVFCVLGFKNNHETARPAETAALAYPNSYVRNYFNAIDGKFQGQENLLVTVGTDVSTVQTNLLNAMSSLGASPFNAHQNASFERSWLASSTASVLGTGGALSTSAFDTQVQNWIRTTNLGYLYRNQFACRWSANKASVSCLSFDASLHEIAASQIPIFNTHAQWTNDFVDAIGDNRAIVDASNSQSFVYGPMYRFYHNFVGAKNDLYATVGWCMLATLLICLIFQFQITATAITLFVIMTGVLEMWGLTFLISVHVNPFMLVNMCYQISLLVAFTVHLVHVFQIKKGENPAEWIRSRNQRVTGALEEVLSGSWHMYVSGFFAVVVMSRSSIPFLNYYYWGMFAMMQFVALVNGMVLLPVLLSLFGPASLYDEYAVPADTSLDNETFRNIVSDEAL